MSGPVTGATVVSISIVSIEWIMGLPNAMFFSSIFLFFPLFFCWFAIKKWFNYKMVMRAEKWMGNVVTTGHWRWWAATRHNMVVKVIKNPLILIMNESGRLCCVALWLPCMDLYVWACVRDHSINDFLTSSISFMKKYFRFPMRLLDFNFPTLRFAFGQIRIWWLSQ